MKSPDALTTCFFLFQRGSNFCASFRNEIRKAYQERFWFRPRRSNPLPSARELDAIAPSEATIRTTKVNLNLQQRHFPAFTGCSDSIRSSSKAWHADGGRGLRGGDEPRVGRTAEAHQKNAQPLQTTSALRRVLGYQLRLLDRSSQRLSGSPTVKQKNSTLSTYFKFIVTTGVIYTKLKLLRIFTTGISEENYNLPFMDVLRRNPEKVICWTRE